MIYNLYKRMAMILCSLLFTSQSPAQPHDAFDVLHYDNSILISDTTDTIQGRTQITGVLTAPQESLFVNLRGLTVDSIHSGAKDLRFTHSRGVLQFSIATLVAVRDTAQITIWYTGIPEDGLIIKQNKYDRKTFFADNWPNRAQYWFPCQDDLTDKASVSFRITAPCRYQIVANGVRTGLINNLDGTCTTSYEERVPIPTYCMVFGAAEFEVHYRYPDNGIPMSHWLYPEDSDAGQQEFRRAPAMLDYYRSRFGPYPFQQLRLVQSSTRYGGMENAGAIFFDEKRIGTKESIEIIVAHEIVHQWLGNHITLGDWTHLWLSEGFAEYFGWQFYEHADGPSKFRVLLKEHLNRYLQDTTAHKSSILGTEPDSLLTLINANTYYKGAFVLHMLRQHLGEHTFWKGLTRYARKYRGHTVITKDFQQTMEKVAGETLDWFFTQWVYQPGIPYLTIKSGWDNQSKELVLQVTQTQDGQVFRFPLTIAIDGDQQKTVWINEKQHTFTFHLDDQPAQVRYDPEFALLALINGKLR